MLQRKYNPTTLDPTIIAESRSPYGLKTYVSLFSSAGVGCYGFKQENFYCIATVELLERRLKIQKYNQKCAYDSGYICGDMTKKEIQGRVFEELDLWKRNFNVEDLDVILATPPCQGMSVANHKKKDELKRNSLVVESIKMVSTIQPKFFIFENVRAFLTSICTDVDGQDKTIKNAIELNLGGLYNVLFKVVNFKDYGNPSSRTRTLVIGVRKDLKEITPYDVFPDRQPERTLRQIIGELPPLRIMGEISENDIYHNFKKYSPRMEAWIADIKEGQSAFDNTDITKIPHSIKNGVIVYNAQKNGDKYTRQCWDKVAPCIHTRSDIMASQNTVHPVDNRVFSIREVMLMMSVPALFQWSDIPFDELNKLPIKEKGAFLKKEEMNIRQNLGEAVPTIIFRQIAHKISEVSCRINMTDQDIKGLIGRKHLDSQINLVDFINKSTRYRFSELSKIAELANANRNNNAAYYTRQDICFTVVENLPEAKGFTEINILEPSVGVGNFIPVLIQKYVDVPSVNIDVVDIDNKSLEVLKALVNHVNIPNNVHINYIHADFLTYCFEKKYDVIVGNPPYKKLTKEKELLSIYKSESYNTDTNNIFSFFIEKSMRIGSVVSLIVPKSLINAPEFNKTRQLMSKKRVSHIIDFGEKGFKNVKIETINFVVEIQRKPAQTIVESYITEKVAVQQQSYLMDTKFPYWIIYRNEDFDEVADKMEFNVFKVYRDRVITKSLTKGNGQVRVLKSRNIGDNQIIDIPEYDSYVDTIEGLDVSKFLNRTNCVLLPNLTYNTRACFLPKGCIADGSVAILTLANNDEVITKEDLSFYATDKFTQFYAIARNLGTRSLNIDNNSVFFFGKLKQQNI
jgi:cytosine-specific methyltransferase